MEVVQRTIAPGRGVVGLCGGENMPPGEFGDRRPQKLWLLLLSMLLFEAWRCGMGWRGRGLGWVWFDHAVVSVEGGAS